METYWYGVIFVFGAIIGSFLNVVIYRLHTGKSLNGRSHCLTCQKTLTWYELFPLFSYLVLRGKCRGCRAYIPSRYFVVEFLTALTYVLVWHLWQGNLVFFILNLVLVSVCIVILVYDIRHTIIPDELTMLITVVAFMYVGYKHGVHENYMGILYDVVAGLGASAFFAGLWYISKGRWIGLGDAKLAFPLGTIAGYGGAFSMVVLSFWVGAGVSLLLLGLLHLLKRGKPSLHFLATPLTMRSEVPFAPFLIMGFVLVSFFHADILTVTYALFFNW